MIVLGFDTATPATAVGLRLADGTMLTAHDDPQPGQRPGHATRLLPLADQLLEQARLEWNALQRIAVGLGPGTFTGLRIGIATARALAQSLSVDLVGIGSLRALAHGALGTWQGHVLAVIDARRGEAFVGAYSPEGTLIAPLALAPEDIGDLLAGDGHWLEHHLHHPPQGGLWLAVGDGAIRFRSHLEALAIEVPPDSSPLHTLNGAAICELALPATPSEPEAILPDYLRRPDAEIALQGATGSLQGAAG